MPKSQEEIASDNGTNDKISAIIVTLYIPTGTWGDLSAESSTYVRRTGTKRESGAWSERTADWRYCPCPCSCQCPSHCPCHSEEEGEQVLLSCSRTAASTSAYIVRTEGTWFPSRDWAIPSIRDGFVHEPMIEPQPAWRQKRENSPTQRKLANYPKEKRFFQTRTRPVVHRKKIAKWGVWGKWKSASYHAVIVYASQNRSCLQ